MTNAEKIRSLPDGELADFIADGAAGFAEAPGMCDVCSDDTTRDCRLCWLDWLGEEAQP